MLSDISHHNQGLVFEYLELKKLRRLKEKQTSSHIFTKIEPGTIMAFAPFDIAALVKEINSSSSSLEKGKNEDARQQCLAAARSLCHALESPLDSALKLCYSDVFINL